MHYFFIALSLILLLSNNAFAAQTGRVNYPYQGIEFTVPPTWLGQVQKNSYLIQTKNKSGFVLLFKNNAKNLWQLKYDADKGFFTNNIQLERSRPFDRLSAKGERKRGLGAEFHGYIRGTPAKAYIIGLINPFGAGITIIAIATTNNYSADDKKIATQIANSVIFSPPKMAPATIWWQHHLLNAQLTYLTTRGNNKSGNRRQKIYNFCSNHAFYYSSNTRSTINATSTFGYMQATNTRHGRWKIGTGDQGRTLLHLRFDNGYVTTYPLEDRTGKPYLNNTPYLYARATHCHK